MLGNAAMILFCGLVLEKEKNLFYYCTLDIFTINIFLTFTDQFGFYDLITLMIDLILLSLLIVDRKRYLK
jgi:hypothetical protein